MVTLLAASRSLLEPSGGQLMILGGLLAAVAAASWWSRRRAGGPTAKQYRREIDGAIREQRQAERDIEELIREMEALSAKIARQIEEGVARLQQATAEADERIARLSGLSGSPPATASPVVDAERVPSEPRTRQVYVLADEGLSAAEIAQRTGRHVGEVELILNLRQAARDGVAHRG